MKMSIGYSPAGVGERNEECLKIRLYIAKLWGERRLPKSWPEQLKPVLWAGHRPKEKGTHVLQGLARPVHPINPNESFSYRVPFPSSVAGSPPAHIPTSYTPSQQEPTACIEKLPSDAFLLVFGFGCVDARLPLLVYKPQALLLLLEKTPFGLICALKHNESQAFSHDLARTLPEVWIPRWVGTSRQMRLNPKVFWGSHFAFGLKL